MLSFCVPQTVDLDARGPPGISDRSVNLGMLSKDCEGPSSDEADDSAKNQAQKRTWRLSELEPAALMKRQQPALIFKIARALSCVEDIA